ncbi:phage capsid protein [Pseudanabaena sp. PCC 6802]|uniref:phage capsid protein n=1 Tax=Pseudanabaena sp. PCC 6802 TaxID=118173 RepID=UPI0003496A6D|nr:phage capsid protein [Pseudanabaena sp. PCC 6802]
MAPQAPFEFKPRESGIAIAYRNDDYIADIISPRIIVPQSQFDYREYSIDQAFRIPDTKVGRTSRPNEVEYTSTLKTVSTEDYGLEDPIPYKDVMNQVPGVDLASDAVEALTDDVMRDRELRVATTMSTLATFPTTNRVTLSGTSQFSDFTNSDPVGTITTALDSAPVTFTHLVAGQLAWTKLRTHPKIINALFGNAGVTNGMASQQAVADFFGLKGCVIGKGWYDSSKEGQAAARSYIWGKHVWLLRVDPLANFRKGLSFMMTAQFGKKVAGTREDPDIGLYGGIRVRVGESVKEVVVANLAGYFIQNAVA